MSLKAPVLAAALALLTGAPGALAQSRDTAAPPVQIGENVWWVGGTDIASILVRTAAGAMLIDGGYETTAPQILANLKALDVDPRSVKILLNTHGHIDHAGGLAALKAATGAKLYASAGDRPLLEAGGKGDFFLGDRAAYPPVKVDKVLADNEKVTLGGVTLTARITPGHTRGCTSWTFPVKVDGQARQALVICSVSVLPGYKLAGPSPSYPRIAADYAATHARLQALPCEVFLGSHGGFFGLPRKRLALQPGQPSPFVDPAGCKAFLTGAEAGFRAELAKQEAAARN
jgi:metallo-beta-lactamase class B